MKNIYYEIKAPESLKERTVSAMREAERGIASKAFAPPLKKTAAVCAAVCIMIFGTMTAAAISGVLDFEALFGNYIRADNSELAVMQVRIEYEFTLNEYLIAADEKYKPVHTSPSEKNEFYLIKSDGTKIKLTASSSMFGYGKNGIVEGYMTFSYADDSYVNILTELDDIISISVNGTVYALE